MKIGLLGTGFGGAHAAIFHRHPDVDEVVVFGRTPAKLDKFAEKFGFATTTDLDAIYSDASVDLVDVCLPTRLHAEHVLRALEAGKHVLCELPLALSLGDARRVAEANAASQRDVFVDMFGRFDPAASLVRQAAADGRYGTLKSLEIEVRTALLWPGYTLGLDSIVLDMMHASLDAIVTTLGRPERVTAAGAAGDSSGSIAEALLTYPDAVARCNASSLMPTPYGVAGGYRATFTDAVLEHAYTAGFTGQPEAPVTTEHTSRGRLELDLPTTDTYTAVIDHVLDCLNGRAANRLAPASVLDTLELTLDLHHQLNP
ncbi:MAG: Gfo/Idh/MocA family protein [Micromonosporaceae bacterium]